MSALAWLNTISWCMTTIILSLDGASKDAQRSSVTPFPFPFTEAAVRVDSVPPAAQQEESDQESSAADFPTR